MGRVTLRAGFALVGLCAVICVGGSAGASAAPPALFNQFPQEETSGSGADQMRTPRGIDTNIDTGDVYAADAAQNRINEFTAAGDFVRAFGWDVAPEGAPGDTAANELEVCSETCQDGSSGSGAGEIATPLGVAIDAAGAVYVAENVNKRVQKFSPSGEFLLMFGGEVNKTSGDDVCTKADLESADICGSGVAGTGPGQFSGFGIGDSIDVGPGGAVLVGDQGRIQSFNPDGTVAGQIALPAARLTRALAVDQVSGDVYVALAQDNSIAFPEVPVFYRLDSDTGSVLDELEAGDPDGITGAPFPIYGFTEALAVDSAGNVYATVLQKQSLKQAWLEVVGFDPSGVCLTDLCPGKEFAKGVGDALDGTSAGAVTTSSACDVPNDDLFVTYFGAGKSYIRGYGPAPDCSSGPSSPPQIKDQYVLSVGTEEATVRAEINPKSQPDTRYYVEYGTAECSLGGCEAQPAPPGTLLTSQTTGVPLTSSGVFLTGLEPGVTYHYWFIAQSSGGGPIKGVGGKVGTDGAEGTFTTMPAPHGPKLNCPNQIFRTGFSAFLPDCRAYEMVSPVNKENGDIVALLTNVSGPAALAQSSPDGAKLSYSAYRAFGDPESAPWTNQYIAERGNGGWSSEAISPPREGLSIPVQLRGLDVQFNVFSPDLCSGWLVQDTEPTLDPAAPAGFPNIYRRENCGEKTYDPLVRTAPQLTVAKEFWPELEGVSSDGKCAVFRADAKLTPEASNALDAGHGIYQVYETCGTQTRLVSVLPDGNATDMQSSAGTASGERLVHRDHSVFHALSRDGSRVYWTAAPGVGKAPGKIYVRDNADQEQSAIVGGACADPDEKACTYPVSETVSGGNATFWGADPDGSSALFAIGGDLYRFDFDRESSTSSLIAGGVKGVLGTSEDLSSIYLASEEARAPGATAGKPNLYLYEQGGSFRFIGTLANADVLQSNQRTPVNVEPSKHVARVSPDGRHAAFMATASLTGYDNVDVNGGVAASEVYVYDADADAGAGALACVSCNPTGARPSGRVAEKYSSPRVDYWVAAQLPTWETQLYARRALADDGSRLFFESFEGLVLRDTNNRQDVYEWQPGSGEKNCEDMGAELFVESARGCLSLISSGESSGDSAFLDATPSGSDVFFTTAASLLAQDPGLVDVYDARVGGGFPPPAVIQPPCEGEACQSATGPPDDPSPASSSFNESDPPKKKDTRPRCPKGKHRVVRKGKSKCVKKAPKTRRHSKHGRAAR